MSTSGIPTVCRCDTDQMHVVYYANYLTHDAAQRVDASAASPTAGRGLLEAYDRHGVSPGSIPSRAFDLRSPARPDEHLSPRTPRPC